MKLIWLFIIGMFGSGYVCTYLLARHRRKPFLPENSRNYIRRLAATCFFVAVALGLFMLYIRLRR